MMGLLGPERAPYLFTNRADGFSLGPYSSLNLSLSTGDHRPHVRANRARAAQMLGRNPNSFISVTQVHGHEAVQVTHEASLHIEADALITRDVKATLAVLTADCVPIVLATADGRCVAAIHAGWRGTAARIAALGALGCARVGACAPEAVWAHVGPAIGPCCFEVDAPVEAKLRAAYPTVAEAFVAREPGRTAIDLWQLNRRALMDTGIPAGNIGVTRICTHCDSRYFSHRRDGAPGGRQGALIALPHLA